MAEDLNQASREAWNTIAPWWDDRVGEGNAFQTQLIGPATERLLALRREELVLDLACGNGLFARRMAALGARVVAVDFSERFLERARARTVENAERIEYRLVDATDEAQLLTLGRERFDAAVCTMALMDMAVIEPLAQALPRLLKPSGRFVFSVLHPCFNNSAARLVVEEENGGDGFVRIHAIKVSRYIRPWVERGLGIRGQPAPHVYFNRPLSTLLGTFLRAGFVLDGLEESVFDHSAPNTVDILDWRHFPEIPPALVARLRLD